MPNIKFEIDPNIGAPAPVHNFSTLVFIPDATFPGLWSDYIDATTVGLWGGRALCFAGHACDINGGLCDWDTLQTARPRRRPRTAIYTVAVAKGSDSEWHGAVDALQINGTVYDFEEHGVTASAWPAPVP